MNSSRHSSTVVSHKVYRVLIVNDSPMLTTVLRAILETNPDYKVVGCANDGINALDFLRQQSVDIALMDIHMPNMGGITATQEITKRYPNVRILIVTATVTANMSYIFSALNSGALDYVQTPTLPFKPGTRVSPEELKRNGQRLLSKLESLIKLRPRLPEHTIDTVPVKRQEVVRNDANANKSHIIAIGTSTGGPSTLSMLLNQLSTQPSCPIIICQHIEPGFSGDFASWLQTETGLNTLLAENCREIKTGNLYIAPAGRNLGITSNGQFEITPPKPGQFYFPNIDHLFTNLANRFGDKVLGIVLTGMGADGATGAKDIIANGGSVLTQDSESALIDSMPKKTRDAIGSKQSYQLSQIAVKMEQWMNGYTIKEQR